MRRKITLFLVLSVSLLLGGCLQLFDSGDIKFVKLVKNKTGTQQAILFKNEGNATTDESYQISIIVVNDRIKEKEIGNTFICDANNGRVQIDTNNLKMNWLSEKQLAITYQKGVKIFLMKQQVNGIKIVYNLK